MHEAMQLKQMQVLRHLQQGCLTASGHQPEAWSLLAGHWPRLEY